MAIKCVVLDFDGTFTDVGQEGPPFSEAYPKFLGQLFARPIDEVWADALRSVESRSPELGWVFNGLAAAPAAADPFILASCASQLVCDHFGVLADGPMRSDVIQIVYRKAYAEATKSGHVAFRPDARAVLDTLVERGLHVAFVTNAATKTVEAKLDGLGLKHRTQIQVFGDACKFLVQETSEKHPLFEALPAALKVDALERPVLLRRGRYFETLARIWEATGTRPEETLVCGDIYELDLALPSALGASVNLIARQNAYPYERNAVAHVGPRGHVSNTLAEMLERWEPHFAPPAKAAKKSAKKVVKKAAKAAKSAQKPVKKSVKKVVKTAAKAAKKAVKKSKR